MHLPIQTQHFVVKLKFVVAVKVVKTVLSDESESDVISFRIKVVKFQLSFVKVSELSPLFLTYYFG